MTPAILDNSSDHHDSPSPSSPIVTGPSGRHERADRQVSPISWASSSPKGVARVEKKPRSHVCPCSLPLLFGVIFPFLLSTCFLVPSSHFISYFLLFADVIIPFSSLLTPLHCCHIPVLFPRDFSVVIFPFSLLPTSLS